LNYYRARYYDAATGRFISEDPISFGGADWNIYRYVGNTPLNGIDPFGKNWISDRWQDAQNLAHQAGNQLENHVEGRIEAITDAFDDRDPIRANQGFDAIKDDISFVSQALSDPLGTAYSVAEEYVTDYIGRLGDEAEAFYAFHCVAADTPDYLRPLYATGGVFAALGNSQNIRPTRAVLQAGLLADTAIQLRRGGRGRNPRIDSDDIPLEVGDYCSFVAGTKVLTAEGDRNIEEIKVGDWVIADDPHTPGGVEKRQVKHTFVHESTSLLDLYVGGEKITTDDEHEFWVKDLGWLAATDLKEGMQLQTNHETAVTVDRIQRREETQQVYNFEVEGFHTYFVSAMGILVHNACVDTRINLAKDRTRTTPIRPRSGHRDSAGFEHVVEGHFDREVTNSTSLFNISPEELKTILQSDVVVSSPVTTTDGDRFSRTVDVGRTIGTSALKYGGASASRIRVLTDRKGNLLTTYPVP
jgi:hypothetical protein